jgi:hypothetical protein
MPAVQEHRRGIEGVSSVAAALPRKRPTLNSPCLGRSRDRSTPQGRPPERWPEVRETLERLRPLAGDAVMAVFGLAMSDAVERAFGAVLADDAAGADEPPR